MNHRWHLGSQTLTVVVGTLNLLSREFENLKEMEFSNIYAWIMDAGSEERNK